VSALLDAILTQTDPVVALILFGILAYLRFVRKDVKEEVRRVRERTQRLEQIFLQGEE